MALEDEVTENWGRMKREIAESDATLTRERADRQTAQERVAELERRLAEIDRESGNPPTSPSRVTVTTHRNSRWDAPLTLAGLAAAVERPPPKR